MTSRSSILRRALRGDTSAEYCEKLGAGENEANQKSKGKRQKYKRLWELEFEM